MEVWRLRTELEEVVEEVMLVCSEVRAEICSVWAESRKGAEVEMRVVPNAKAGEKPWSQLVEVLPVCSEVRAEVHSEVWAETGPGAC